MGAQVPMNMEQTSTLKTGFRYKIRECTKN
jgi:hypothetical protein